MCEEIKNKRFISTYFTVLNSAMSRILFQRAFSAPFPTECCVNELRSQMEMFQKPLCRGLITLEKGAVK